MAVLTNLTVKAGDIFASTPWGVVLEFNDRCLLFASLCCQNPIWTYGEGPACGRCQDSSPLPAPLAARVFSLDDEQWALETLIGGEPLAAVLLASEVRSEMGAARAAKYGAGLL